MGASHLSTVLVTGAGGFVGSAVVRRLVRTDGVLWDGSPIDRVVALLRPEGSPTRLEMLRPDDRWTIEHVDLRDDHGLRSLLRRVRPRAAVNTALDAGVYSGEPVGHAPLETLFAGLEGPGETRMVHAGSAWVLAPGDQLDESARVDPRSPYAQHKAEEDQLLPVLGERTGVAWIGLRLFNIFGRYEKPSRLLPYLVSQLSRNEPAEVSHGAQTRDFNDVDDIAEAFVLSLAAPHDACGALYHIGSGRATTVRELALAVAEVAGDPGLVRFGTGETPDQDLSALVSDPARARRVLGWLPEDRLAERLRSAAEWWLEQLAGSAGDRPERQATLR